MPLLSKHPLVFVGALFVFSAVLFANDLPGYDEVNLLSQRAKQTADDFFNKTFEIRMRYEYAGRFIDPNDKVKLLELATQASADLVKIAQDQNNLKMQIEDYKGDDWEIRFGQTGLWRSAASDFFKTTMSRLEIQYYLALACDGAGQADMLRQIISALDTLGDGGNSPDWHLLRAEIFTQLSLADPSYKSVAKNELDIILSQKDVPCRARFKAEMEMIKLSARSSLVELAEAINRTDCKSNGEITMMLACLGHRFEPESLENTLTLFSIIQNTFGKIVFEDLQQRYNFDKLADVNSLPITVYEAELAADAVSGVGLENNALLFEQLVSAPKFRTPVLLFIAGRSMVDSYPAKTTRLWIDASRLMKEKPCRKLGLSAETIAKFAIASLEKLGPENKADCQLVTGAYENYFSIATPAGDPDFNYIEYYYAAVALDNCDKNIQSQQLLEKMAATPGQYQNHARFELINRKLEQTRTEAERNALSSQLDELISNIPFKGSENRDLRSKAAALYCQIHLDRADPQSAQKVLDMLDINKSAGGAQYDFFRARALHTLGRLEESVSFMTKAVDANDNSIAPQAILLLSEILDKIELWQQNARDFNEMLRNCSRLAQFAHESLSNRQTALIFAEISILDGKKISLANENDTSLLHPKARLLMAQGDFEQASRLWAKIVELRNAGEQSLNRKSYGWWQAKFYELDCLTKLPSANLKDIHHAIEVLQSTYTEIPVPFAEKLDLLKQHCTIN